MMLRWLALVAGLISGTVQAELPQDFVDMKKALPDALYDIRYFSDNNFVGEPVDGYQAPTCVLHKQAAAALKRVSAEAGKQGYKLVIFDCYRPQRAVAHFMRWARDPNATATKAEYYPNLPKTALVGEYIAEKSGHSRGATVDLTLARQGEDGQWQRLDMGTPFDRFDTRSNTLDPRLSDSQRANRLKLRALMEQQGFENYPKEWWHYSLVPQPYPDTYFDFPVRSAH